jgi:hypothetical protein
MMLGDKLHTKNKENTRFLVERQAFYTHVLKVYISTQKKNFQKNFQTYRLSLQPLILYFN